MQINNKYRCIYYSRLAYLKLIDNLKKYTDDNGDIDHKQVVKDFIKDKSLHENIIDYIELMWLVIGRDEVFLKKIKRCVKRSVYSKESI